MTDLEHLHQILIGIISDIDGLCKDNNIKYYLLGGSAIGAIRHHGFIPWDDDLDIVMDNSNYQRFIAVAKEKLNKDKYYLQIGLKDWPLYFTKVRLKGTVFDEGENSGKSQGIFVDVFKMDNVSSNTLVAMWQYFWAKAFLSYQLSQRKVSGNISPIKRILRALSFPMRNKHLRDYARRQVEFLNDTDSDYLGLFYGRTRWRNAIVKKDWFGDPVYVPFEGISLPVPERYDQYLTKMFGDYMTPPPVNKRVSTHYVMIDFGKY